MLVAGQAFTLGGVMLLIGLGLAGLNTPLAFACRWCSWVLATACWCRPRWQAPWAFCPRWPAPPPPWRV
jgi:hypothetical protein